jgi:hypothetical protein
MIKSNRFDLEEALININKIGEDIETMIYAIGDSPTEQTEDKLLNMLIGIKELHQTRYEKMWNIFESLVKDKTISNPNWYPATDRDGNPTK